MESEALHGPQVFQDGLELGIQQDSLTSAKTLLPSLKRFLKMSCFPPLCFSIGSPVPWDLRSLNSHCELLTCVP